MVKKVAVKRKAKFLWNLVKPSHCTNTVIISKETGDVVEVIPRQKSPPAEQSEGRDAG